MKKILIATLILLTMVISCDNGGGGGDPHEGTITAFNRTVKVIGDASISATDFENAKAKLKSGLDELQRGLEGSAESAFGVPVLDRPGFAIVINAGSGVPTANTQKQLTVGIGYLLATTSTDTVIAGGIGGVTGSLVKATLYIRTTPETIFAV